MAMGKVTTALFLFFSAAVAEPRRQKLRNERNFGNKEHHVDGVGGDGWEGHHGRG